MKEIIQNNINFFDSAYDIQLRVDFNNGITEVEIDEISSKLDSELFELGIGFGSSQGINFISAALLDFGKTPTFIDLRRLMSQILSSYNFKIDTVSFSKAEYLQTHFQFIAKLENELEEVHKMAIEVFDQVNFKDISTLDKSPEYKYFLGSDKGETIILFISELEYDSTIWVRFSIGSKTLTDLEIEEMTQKINKIHSKSLRIKWNGFDFDYETESWKIPVQRKLFELLNNESTTKPK